MRLMQGTMGAGGAPQSRLSSNDLGRVMAPPTPPAATFADNMDPEQLRRLMQMMKSTQGRIPGSTGPGGSMLNDSLFQNLAWTMNNRREGQPWSMMAPDTAAEYKSQGLTVAPYSITPEGRRFGASGQAFRQEDPRMVAREQQRTMGRR